MPRTLAIVPALDESATIASVVDDLRRSVPGIDVVVVDDGSSDDTAERARAAGARVLRLPFNLGIGAAMQTGFRYAVANGVDIALQVDADGQHPADEIERLIAPILEGRADVTVGTRYRAASDYDTPLERRAGQRFFSGLVSFLTGQTFTDTTSGFRAYDARALSYLAHNYSRDYPEVNALVALCQNDYRVEEVPVTMRERQGGRSHITTARAVFYMFKVSLSTVMTAARRRTE